MKEYKITKERLEAMAKKCPEAKEVLKEGFPEAFEEEWENITRELTAEVHMLAPRMGYLKLLYNGADIAYTRSGKGSGLHFELINLSRYKLEVNRGDFTVFKRRE